MKTSKDVRTAMKLCISHLYKIGFINFTRNTVLVFFLKAFGFLLCFNHTVFTLLNV